MNNKKIMLLILALLLFEAFVYADSDEFVSKETAVLVKKIIDIPTDENAMPSFMRDFIVENIPKGADVDENDEDRMLEIAKRYKPTNYNDFAKVLCPLIIKETKKSKNAARPSLEGLPKKAGMPKAVILRENLRFWTQYLRRLFEADGNDNAALVVAYAGYYIARDIEESYSSSYAAICKSLAIAFSGTSSQGLFKWAARPREKSAKIGKYLAKDLLNLVKNEYLWVNNTEFDKATIFSVFYESAVDKKTETLVHNVFKSDYFKGLIRFFFVEPTAFLDKPYYLCKLELEEYSNKYDNKTKAMMDELAEDQSKIEAMKKDRVNFDESKISPELVMKMLVNRILSMAVTDYSKIKEKQEEKLAKMEILAIALAYNSYFCENKKEPESIDILEKWFGEKFPVNRFTGKSYVFNSEKGCVLYNYGLNDKKDSDNEEEYRSDDIFFKFSTK